MCSKMELNLKSSFLLHLPLLVLLLILAINIPALLGQLTKQQQQQRVMLASQMTQVEQPGNQSVGSRSDIKGDSDKANIRVLALFSSTKNDLGIDHRLGRQVLKLAVDRARQIHAQRLASIDLVVNNDDADCTSLNLLPSVVAEHFYLDHHYMSSSTSSQLDGTWSDGMKVSQHAMCTNISQLAPPGGQTKNWRLGASQCESVSIGVLRQKLEDLSELDGFFNQTDFKLSSKHPTDARPTPIDDSPVEAIIGPSCDHLVDLIARMAAYWRTPIYSIVSIGSKFAQKDIYRTLTRLSPSIEHLCMFIVRTMERFKWRHLAIIADTSEVENSIVLDNFKQTISRLAHIVPIEHRLFTFSTSRHQQQYLNLTSRTKSSSTEELASSEACTNEALGVLLEAKKVARLFLFLINQPQVIRQLLLCSHSLGQNNGEFTFLAIDLGLKSFSAQPDESFVSNSKEFTTQQQVVTSTGATSELPGASSSHTARLSRGHDWYLASDSESNNAIAREMFESLLVFSVQLPLGDEYSSFVEQTLDLVHQAYPSARFEHADVGPLAVALHDSLLLAVETHLRSLEANKADIGQFTNGEDDNLVAQSNSSVNRAQIMWGQSYSNGLTAGLHINENGDQELSYVLSDLEPQMGLMRPVASYLKERRQLELIMGTYIHWPSRRSRTFVTGFSGNEGEGRERDQTQGEDEPPPDEPECGFTGEAERCIDRQGLYAALFLSAIIAMLALLGGSVTLFKYRHIKYQMQLDDYWWKIDWADLTFIRTTDSLASNAQSVARALRSEAGSQVSIGTGGAYSYVSVTRSVAHTNKEAIAGKDGKLTPRRPALIVTASDHGSQKPPPETTGGGSSGGSVAPGDFMIRSLFSSVVRASNLALYKGELVIVKQLNIANPIEISRELLVELKSMRDFVNDNLAKFVGLIVDAERPAIVYEYCSRGSLQELLLNEGVAMDWTLKYSIMGDVVNGLNFIHTTLLNYHGRLKSSNLVLDGRFTVKLTDFGLQSLYSQLDLIQDRAKDEDSDEDAGQTSGAQLRAPVDGQIKLPADSVSLSVSAYNMDSVSAYCAPNQAPKSSLALAHGRLKNRGAERFFWTAPEHLRDKNLHFSGSKKGDVYSLAIILSELLTRKEPYHYGTNARPHWPTIKSERRRLQQQQKQTSSIALRGAAKRASRTPVASSEISGGGAIQGGVSSLVSTIGKGTRRAQARLRRGAAGGAQVKPLPHQTSTETGVGAETGSILSVSSQSIVSSHHEQPSSNTVAGGSVGGKFDFSKQNKPAISGAKVENTHTSVTAIDEEDQIQENDDYFMDGIRNERIESLVAPSGGGVEQRQEADEILDQLRMGIQPEPVRPYLPNFILHDVNPRLIELVRSCWNEAPNLRPNMAQVRNQLRRITRGVASRNYLDNLLERLQGYAENLEQIVDSKSGDIMEEKKRSEELLYQLVPKFVADRLKHNEMVEPQVFDGATIYFSDIIGFEKYASVMSPCEQVDLLNNIYSSFDSIISSFDVTKIETIIDQFLVASGISLSGENRQHSTHQARPALDRTTSQGGEKGDEAAGVEANQPSGEVSIEESRQAEDRRHPRRRHILQSLRRSVGSQESRKGKPPPGGQPVDGATSNQVTVDAAGNKLIGEEAQILQPNSADPSHYRRNCAEQIARMALCIRDLVKSFHFRQNLKTGNSNSESSGRSLVASTFNIRIGIHSGKVCAGIVGAKRPKFCLIGDTVNVASRMHTNSKANRIQVSGDTKELLELVPGFSLESRGRIEVKGKGSMETYWLESCY